MQDPSQPKSGPITPAGFRLPVSMDLYRAMGVPALACIAAATGLGLAVGVAIAVTVGHPAVSAAPWVSDALASRSAGSTPAVLAASQPSLLSKVDPSRAKVNKGPAAGPLLLPAAPKATVAKAIAVKAGGRHKHHSARKGWEKRKFPGKLAGMARRRPYVIQAAVAAAEPTSLESAKAATAAGPFFVGIEGDVTIAGYEPITGTLQTYEGETYILASNSAGSGAIAWENYPFNVHYRCDDIGDCTLMRGRATVTAKLTR